MSRIPRLGFSLVVVCVIATALAFANPASTSATGPTPTVDGWTISWADDGWYQVQTKDGSKTVCEGGRSCDVKAKDYPAGDYKVINHTPSPKKTWIVNVSGNGGDSSGSPTPRSGWEEPKRWNGSGGQTGVIWKGTPSLDYIQVEDIDRGYAAVSGCAGRYGKVCRVPELGRTYNWKVHNIDTGESWKFTISTRTETGPYAFEDKIISTSRGTLVVQRYSPAGVVHGGTVCTLNGVGKECRVGKGRYKVKNLSTKEEFDITVLGKVALNGSESETAQQIEANAFRDLAGHDSPGGPPVTATFVVNNTIVVSTRESDGRVFEVSSDMGLPDPNIQIRYPDGRKTNVSIDISTGLITGTGPNGENIEGQVTSLSETGLYQTQIRVDGVLVFDQTDKIDTAARPPGTPPEWEPGGCPFNWCPNVPRPDGTTTGGDSSTGSVTSIPIVPPPGEECEESMARRPTC